MHSVQPEILPRTKPARWQDPALRLLDLGLLVLLMPLVLPLLALAWPGSQRESEHCIGRHGRPFSRVRLRLPAGWRGRLLGALRIDRAPVLFNILKGEMAWVGPRPVQVDEPVPAELKSAREQVRPGLYSLWALRQRTSIDYDSEWACDAEQLARRGLQHDLGVLIRSLLAGLYGQPEGDHSRPGLVDTLRVHPLTMNDTLAAIETHCAHAGTDLLQLCFVNPDCVNIARRNARYRKVVNQAGLVVPDGIGMRLAGRILKRGFRQNVNGTDLFPRLCERLSASGGHLFLLGGQPGVAEATAFRMQQQYPELIVAGTHHGYFSADEEPTLIESIRASGAEVLLVAMGAPRQEFWIHEHAEACGVRVAMGVGGLFDFYAGRIPRAPGWLRELGGEWLYRLYQEPGRMWRRYLVGNFSFLTAILMQRWLGSVDLAQLESNETAPLPCTRTHRAMLLMDFPHADDWMGEAEDGRALLPLGDRPLLYRSLESLAGLGCREVRIFASRGLARLRAEVGGGERWGLQVQVESVTGFNDAKRRIGRIRLADEESIWLVRADHWLPAGALRGGDASALWLYLDDDNQLQWTGWARVDEAARTELLAALAPEELSLHRLPESLDRIGAPAPTRFDRPALALQGQKTWLARKADAYELLEETQPGVRIAATARIAPGAQLIAPVEIGENTIVGRQARLGPNVVIGSDCRIEGEVEIRDSLVADRVALRGPAQMEQSIASPTGLLNAAYDVWLPAAATGDLLGPALATLPDPSIRTGERALALGLFVLGILPAALLRAIGQNTRFSHELFPGLPAVIAGRHALVGVGDDAELPTSVREAGWAAALGRAPRGLIRPRDAFRLAQLEEAVWADVHWLVQPSWRERLRLLRRYLLPQPPELVTVPPQSGH